MRVAYARDADSDQALGRLLAEKRASPYRDDLSVEALREAHAAAGATVPLPDEVEHRAVNAGGIPSEWIEAPGARDGRYFLFIHGGGYYRGSIAATRATAARISAMTGARVLSIDYRLAPEHPYPAAIDDTRTAYHWLLGHGAGPEGIAVGGVSAGGGLTLALLLALRDAGEALPAAAIPMSPWTDLTQSGGSFRANAATDPVICKPYLDRMARLYLNGVPATTPYASPLHGELSGLPPLLIQVGEDETLRDDSTAFAEKAQAAGVDVTLEVWPQMFHGWQGSAHVLADAREALRHIGTFYRARVAD